MHLSPVLVLLALASGAQATVSVGAIRWDAWYGAPADKNYGMVGRAVTNDLSPEEYHYRLPFFAKDHSAANASKVDVNGNTEAAMTAEINYAKQFGIDYWAFCAYPIGCKDYHPKDADCPKIQCCADNVALSYALIQYLNNPNNHLVNFSLILQSHASGSWFPTSELGGNETLDQETSRYVRYFQMPNYQKVMGGRPLLYIFSGSYTGMAPQLAALKNATQAAMGVEPYLVVMGGNAKTQKPVLPQVGAQAGSNYCVMSGDGVPHKPPPFETGIRQPEIAYWQGMKEAGLKLVPPVTAGWDPRPRQYYPVPWGGGGCVDCYVQDPSMAELEQHTKEAYEFAVQNPDVVEAQSIIISAWNENDEGHWIMPSLHNGTEKLEAVQRGLRAAKEALGQP